MLKIPENLNKDQQDHYKKAWLDSLNTLINAAKAILFIIALILIYIPLEKDIQSAFKAKPAINTNPSFSSAQEEDYDRVENGIHVQTGLAYAPGFDLVRANCTVCHSAKLVTQNRASREGWDQMIIWMQEKQGLWELGEKKAPILDYLSTHYAPMKKGRRDNLDVAKIEWYILNLDDNSE